MRKDYDYAKDEFIAFVTRIFLMNKQRNVFKRVGICYYSTNKEEIIGKR